MSDELTDIQKLIRLKRYEQPPEGYFDDFLVEFQHRQRAEMLRRPVRQLVWERINLWLDNFRVPTLAYASILAVAIAGAGIMMKSPSNTTRNVAGADGNVLVAPASPINPVANVSTLQSSYVLEKRPVSYDAPFSF